MGDAAIPSIIDHCHQCKLLLIVREPVDRMVSNLVHSASMAHKLARGTPPKWKSVMGRVLYTSRDTGQVNIMNKTLSVQLSDYYRYVTIKYRYATVNIIIFIIKY